jgi:hypothetical protein
MGMTELVNAKRYALRLLERHVFYDINGSQLWREWPAGAIVTDSDTIKLLEARGAPIEKIANP